MKKYLLLFLILSWNSVHFFHEAVRVHWLDFKKKKPIMAF